MDSYEHLLGRRGRILLGALDRSYVINIEGNRGIGVKIGYFFEPAEYPESFRVIYYAIGVEGTLSLCYYLLSLVDYVAESDPLFRLGPV